MHRLNILGNKVYEGSNAQYAIYIIIDEVVETHETHTLTVAAHATLINIVQAEETEKNLGQIEPFDFRNQVSL